MSSRLVPPVTGNAVFLTSRQVRERYGGRSRAWLPRMVAAGRFPKPYRIAGSWFQYWKLCELEAFDAAQIASAEPKPRRKATAPRGATA